MTFHAISGSRRYEYRVLETGERAFSDWRNGGAATAATLQHIELGCAGLPAWEIREVCDVADDDGNHVGRLVFSRLVRRYEAE